MEKRLFREYRIKRKAGKMNTAELEVTMTFMSCVFKMCLTMF